MYDDVTSNKYVSLGISVASTAFMARRIFPVLFYFESPITFAISACAGIAFALLANMYIIHSKRVKTEEGKNSLYATVSLIVAFTPLGSNRIYRTLFARPMRNFFRSYKYEFQSYALLSGFGISFLVTNLALQIFEGKTKFEFQSPIKFS